MMCESRPRAKVSLASLSEESSRAHAVAVSMTLGTPRSAESWPTLDHMYMLKAPLLANSARSACSRGSHSSHSSTLSAQLPRLRLERVSLRTAAGGGSNAGTVLARW